MELRIFLLGTLFVAGLVIILSILYLRYRNLQMLHQERMTALEKEVPVPIGNILSPWSPRIYMLRGLLWSFAGAALVVSLLGLAAAFRRPETAETTLYRAKNIAQDFNISADEAKQIAEKDRYARQYGMPSSVALLGLIPMSVGLAYLVFYYTESSRQKGDVQRNSGQ